MARLPEGFPLKKKIVLLLQGGGALGAFQCGAWKAILPFIRESGHELVAVAGASVGALNGSMIARHCHGPDGGVDVIQDFWRKTLANPPVPLFPMPGEYWRAWNGLLTNLLFGNPALFTPAYPHWNLAGELFRFYMPLYQTRQAEQTMSAYVGEYQGTTPLLAVALTDVESGAMRLVDSASGAIVPRMLAASAAIPLLFSPVDIDGSYYWDGEMRSNTLLPDVFALLQSLSRNEDETDEYLVIVVDMFRSAADRLPSSSIQSQYRFLNILMGGKLDYDRRIFDAGNLLLDAMERLRRLAGGDGGSPLAAAVEEEYRKARAMQHARVELLHIGRRQFPYEYISRDFDYSPQYIERLIEQGFHNARSAVEAYQETAHRDTGDQSHADPGRGNERRTYPRLVQRSTTSEE